MKIAVMLLLLTVSVQASPYCDLNGERIEGAITPKQCRSLYKDQLNGIRVHGKWIRKKRITVDRMTG